MSILFQLAAILALAACLYAWRISMRRRNAQSWEAIVARLSPDWNARELLDLTPPNHETGATLIEKARRIFHARGLWTIFGNAGVMLEMADYAARNSDTIDASLLSELRCEAMRIRLLVLVAVARYATSAINQAVSLHVLRVESAYAGMAMQITAILEVNAPDALPSFVSAM